MGQLKTYAEGIVEDAVSLPMKTKLLFKGVELCLT